MSVIQINFIAVIIINVLLINPGDPRNMSAKHNADAMTVSQDVKTEILNLVRQTVMR